MPETPQQAAERRLLGVGLSFPLRVSASGTVALSAGRNRVREAVEQLIMTDPMERPYRVRNGVPYGTRVRRMLFDDVEAVRAIALPDIRRALAVWEPRVELLAVQVDEERSRSDSGVGAALVVQLRYRVRATGVEDFHVINVPKEGRP